jgi:23S rRNA pseudouridine1911/1915/1917 synthase
VTAFVHASFEIISEDSDLLVINKPTDLVCHPTKGDEYSSVISRVRLYLGKDSHPHLVNRLDRETTGVTVVAKTNATARQLGRIWEQREVEKEYLAVVHGHVRDSDGLIEAPLGKDEASRVAIKDCVRPEGAKAATQFYVQRRFERHVPVSRSKHPALLQFSLLRVVPLTGRKHQIRIHLAHIGHPVVGDKLYGGDEDLYLAFVEGRLTAEQRLRLILANHALHAQKVRFTWRGQEKLYSAEPEEWFGTFIGQKL